MHSDLTAREVKGHGINCFAMWCTTMTEGYGQVAAQYDKRPPTAVKMYYLSGTYGPGIPGMDSTFPLVPIANFLACSLVLLSLSRGMFQSWNIGQCSLATWVTLAALKVAINSLIWSDNVKNVAPVWCDISMYISFSFTRYKLTSCTILK